MSNYPEGSVRGSGIFERDVSLHMECGAEVEPDHNDNNGPEVCPFDGDVDVRIDDFGMASWECPRCLTEHEGVELADEDPYADDRTAQMERYGDLS